MKTKLTPKLQETICQYITDGMFANRACALCGIDSRSMYFWLEKAEAAMQSPDYDTETQTVPVKPRDPHAPGNPPNDVNDYIRFYHAIKKAEAKDQYNSISLVKAAEELPQNWMATFRRLESRYPKEFLREKKVDLGVNENLQRLLTSLTEALNEPDDDPLTEIEGNVRELPIGDDTVSH